MHSVSHQQEPEGNPKSDGNSVHILMPDAEEKARQQRIALEVIAYIESKTFGLDELYNKLPYKRHIINSVFDGPFGCYFQLDLVQGSNPARYQACDILVSVSEIGMNYYRMDNDN